MKLIMIRHGETDESQTGIIHGHLDFLLNKNGVKQANNLARIFKNEKIDLICTSDLSRALEMARIIASQRKSIEFIVSTELRERNYGEYQGKKWVHVENKICKDKIESDKHLIKRVNNFIHCLWTDHSDKTVLIVTHGGVIKALLGDKLVGDRSRFKHGSVHQFMYDGLSYEMINV